MNPHDKNNNPISSPLNSPPPSSPRPPGTQSSDITPPPYTMPFPLSSAQFEPGFSTSSSDTSPLSTSTNFPLSVASSFIDFESLQNLEETISTVPTATTEYGESLPGVPQPLECLYETPVPPFLSKTYDLVDDHALDSIISWAANGQSFVVWDPVEFSRIILPRNFKHNNFSSFVRQLNTYGFRKIDADRWEFANEGFLRGKKHLLKNIQRRKSPHSQHVGSLSGSASESMKAALEGEIVKLRKERSLMMQEMAELQQQQRGTIQHIETVGEKLQAAEQRQKQMVSFLAKVFQNPAFVARLKQIKEQRKITSPRTMRKFVKHQQHELGEMGSSTGRQIVKYGPDLPGLTSSTGGLNLDPVAVEQLPEFPLQDSGESLGFHSEYMPFQSENIASDDITMAREPLRTSELVPSQGAEDPLFKGKNVLSSPPEIMPEYFVSFPEELAKEKSVPEFASIGIESMGKEQELWTIGYETASGMCSSSNELWGNVSNCEITELGVSSGLSDLWDLSSLQAAGSSGVEKWLGDESSFREPDDQAGKHKDDSSKNVNPSIALGNGLQAFHEGRWDN